MGYGYQPIRTHAKMKRNLPLQRARAAYANEGRSLAIILNLQL